MKIAILCDTHFGVRNNSKVFLDNQEKFFEDIFFPYIDDNDIKTIIHLGDTFDNRKVVNYYTLSRVNRFFHDEIAKREIDYHVLVGNHDVFYKNTNEINSVELTIGEMYDFNIYVNESKELLFDNCKMLLCPWINKENEEQILKTIKSSKANILAGHFEIEGFEMMKGRVSDFGYKPSMFKKFEYVWSGHFHRPSKHRNIEYLGTPYDMNWNDYDDNFKGFRIFDTKENELKSIENPYRLYHKLYYDDNELTYEDIGEMNFDLLENAFVKVHAINKSNPQLLDILIDKIEQAGAADVKIVENQDIIKNSEDLDMEDVQDTKKILQQYIQALDTKIDKSKIQKKVDDLYNEAINL